MKKNNVLRLILDFTIAASFLLEINYDFIGGKLHEIIGLIIGGLVVVHCLINRKWFIYYFIKKREYTLSHLFKKLIKLLLIIGFSVLILSGIMISVHISQSILTSDPRLWSEIHHLVVKVCGILLIIHILLHRKYIMACLIKGKTSQKAIMGIGAFLVILSIVLGLAKTKKDVINEKVTTSSGEKSSNLDINKSVKESVEKSKDSSNINTENIINQKSQNLSQVPTSSGKENSNLDINKAVKESVEKQKDSSNIKIGDTINQKSENSSQVPTSSGEENSNLDINKPVQESVERQKDSSNINSRETINQKAGKLLLKFNFNRASTLASNQYAIWIEDSKGNLVKTLYASDFTANGGYKFRPDSLKVWVRKSTLDSMSDSKVDAVSGATPRAGQQTYIWDCKDDQGNIVQNGEYYFYLEGTLYWSSSVVFSGSFTVGGESMKTIQIAEKYTENTETNRDMISSVTASYVVD